jgi:hypothetical protein
MKTSDIAALLGHVKPATTSLLYSLAQSSADVREHEHEHEHPKHEDLYCLNLTSYMAERMPTVLRRLVDTEARYGEAVATVARLEQKHVELERIANAERVRAAELPAPAAAQQRKGYEAAIEVMRQEKLPMSVGLLEAQLELNALDGLAPELTIYRAEHPDSGITLGHYGTAAAARKHCEAVTRREIPGATLDWIEDDEDRVAELVASFGEDERSTGYIVTALDIASEYDDEADE